MKSPLRMTVSVLALLLPLLVVQFPAAADSWTTHDVLVSEDPVDGTPHALDGEIVAIAEMGDLMVVGGTFTTARNANGTADLVRNYIMAFDRQTFQISTQFVPDLDGKVMTLEATPDGDGVYVGGRFVNVNGQRHRGLVRLDAAGNIVDEFDAKVNKAVYDMSLAGGRLFIGGNFTKVTSSSGAVNRTVLAALDPVTGAVDPGVDHEFADPRSTWRTTGVLSIDDLDTSPEGSRVFVAGNFTTVDGQARELVALIDAGASPSVLADWRTDDYEGQCRAALWPDHIRDIDVSPDGTYVVIGTTGAYGAPPSLCDTAARFELWRTGDVDPTWVAYTGGDTLYGVVVTDAVVYVGGHQRWMNNPWRADRVGPGAVDRMGLAALDPRNGVPFDWDPRRDPRGRGTYDLFATEEGVWVGDDTPYVNDEYHNRLALLPVAGGTSVASTPPARLPADVFTVTTASTTKRTFDGSTAGLPEVIAGIDAADRAGMRGAELLGSDLYAGFSDGTFRRYQWQDGVLSSPVNVDLNGLTSSYFDVADLTSLAFDDVDGQLYYTLAGRNGLYRRGFTQESEIVEGRSALVIGSAPGIMDWTQVRGSFMDGSTLYAAHANGDLYAIELVDGTPVSSTVVAGPSLGGAPWNANGLFAEGDGAPVNEAPVADATVECDELECHFDSMASRDDDGSIAARSWLYDGQEIGTTEVLDFSFDAEADHDVTLVVTDDDGATDSVVVVASTTAPPTVQAIATCQLLVCNFDATGSNDAGDPVTVAWDFGDGATGSGLTTSHEYAAPGDVDVDVTATDDEGQTTTITIVAQPAAPVDVDVAADCSGLSCSFEAVTVDGAPTSWDWDFGDGGSGTGQFVDHDFAASGSYTVTVTAADNGGASSDTASTTVDVQELLVAVADVACDELACTFDGSASQGAPQTWTWDFGDGSGATGATATHTYAQAGTYPVTLVVGRDGETDSTSTSVTVDVTPQPGEILLRSVANDNRWSSGPQVQVPSSVQDGDVLLAFLTVNGVGHIAGEPTGGGWQPLGTVTRQGIESEAWWRPASAGDAGTTVSVPLATGRKADLTLAVYAGADPAGPIAASAGLAESTSTATHVTPDVVTPVESLVVSYWADKSAVTSDWTTAAAVRSESIGVGGGHVSTLLADGGAMQPAGTQGMVAATADAAEAKAVMWTVALTTQQVQPELGLRGVAGSNGWTDVASVDVPATVQADDVLLAFVTVNRVGVTGDLAGWTHVGQQVDGNIQTDVWTRVAQAGDAGSPATVSLSRASKADILVVAYEQAAPALGPVALAGEPGDTATHTTPQVTTTQDALIVSYWADRTAATTSWTAPASEIVRYQGIGKGGGRITALLADSGAARPAGLHGGLDATADSSDDTATMVTVAVLPRP